MFSGDLGPKGPPTLRDPAVAKHAALLLLATTYGDRNHRDRPDTIRELGEIFEHAGATGATC